MRDIVIKKKKKKKKKKKVKISRPIGQKYEIMLVYIDKFKSRNGASVSEVCFIKFWKNCSSFHQENTPI